MWKILKWVVIVLVVGFVVLVVWRMFVLGEKEKTAVQVEKIHNTKLALADVLGENLPPVPSNPDSSIPGFDANGNGIRDDVELAIFSAYPNSARTRAVLLQYALALQMEVVQELVNTGTVIAVAQVSGKAASCIGESYPRDNLREFIKITDGYVELVDKLQLNTPERKEAQKAFYRGNLDSYSDIEGSCDIELSTLPN